MAIDSTAIGGNYSNPASWTGGVVPTIGAADGRVIAGSTIVIDVPGCGCGTDPGAGNPGLTVEGTLKFTTAASNADLTVRGDIVFENGSTFGGDVIAAARRHKLKIDCVATIGKYKLWKKDTANFLPEATLPNPWYSRLSADANSAQAVIKVVDDVQTAGWNAGDLIVIPQCITDGASNTYLQSEIREILSFDVTGKEITVTANLTYTHNKTILTNALVTWKRDCPVVLLSRPICIESYNADFPAYVVNCTVTDVTDWYPKGVEFKELGKSATEPALTYRGNPALAVAYTNPAYGNMSGFSIHPGKNKKGFPGCLYSLYKATALADHDFSNWVVVGSAIAGADGSSTYLFADVYDIVCNLNINRSFIFGGSSFLAILFGGGSAVGQKLVTITNLEAAGFVYGPGLCKVGTASEIHVWGSYYIGIYQTSLNFSCTNMVVLCGYYGIFFSVLSIKNFIINLYTKTTVVCALQNPVDIEITNWVSDDVVLYNNHTGLIEIRVNDFDIVENDFFTFTQEGTIYSCKSTFASPRDNVRTAANGAILLEPISATLVLEFEHEISVENGKSVVATGYMYKDAAYNGASEPSITLSGAGMTTSTMAYDEMTDAGGGFYQWTVSGTAARTTQAFLTVSCIGTAGHIVVADVIPLGADINTGDYLHYSHGSPAKTLAAAKLSAPDIAVAVAANSTIQTILANVGLIKIETDKVQTIDDNVDAILTDTGTTLPAAIAAISVDLTPVLTAIGLTAEQASLIALFAALDVNILKILTDIAALTPSGGGSGGLMAFTTWAALETAMLNDLATGSWRVEEYAVGDQKKKFKSFDEFKKVLTYVQHMAALDAGEVTKVYAKQGGRD